jgi:hypothetical protein
MNVNPGKAYEFRPSLTPYRLPLAGVQFGTAEEKGAAA